MIVTIRAGSCIQIKSSINNEWHPYIVITEPSGNPLEVVVVNLTEYKEGIDESAVFEIGDHPEIAKKSMINYFDARIARVDRLQSHIDENRHRLKADCSQQMLGKIHKGFKKSKAVNPKIRAFCEGKF